MSEQSPWLILGLGNPGPQYAGTRHNAGFLALDTLLQQCSSGRAGFAFQKKFNAEIAEATVEGRKVFLGKPQTFMNLSGQSAVAITQFFKIPIGQLIVVHDELDVPLGEIKIKLGGGSGGHNGIKSIEGLLGNGEFLRVRIGIGKPLVGGERSQTVQHVLQNFAKDEQSLLDRVLKESAHATSVLVTSTLKAAQDYLSGEKSKRIKAERALKTET